MYNVLLYKQINFFVNKNNDLGNKTVLCTDTRVISFRNQRFFYAKYIFYICYRSIFFFKDNS